MGLPPGLVPFNKTKKHPLPIPTPRQKLQRLPSNPIDVHRSGRIQQEIDPALRHPRSYL